MPSDSKLILLTGFMLIKTWTWYSELKYRIEETGVGKTAIEMWEYKTGKMKFIDGVEWKNIMLRKKGLRGCARGEKNNYRNGFLLKYVSGSRKEG